MSSSGRLPKDLWNYVILEYLDLETLVTLEYASKYFYSRLSTATALYCECCDLGDNSTEQAPTCRSLLTLAANRSDFSHEKFGNNLACGIIKKLVRRSLLMEEAPYKICLLYRL